MRSGKNVTMRQVEDQSDNSFVSIGDARQLVLVQGSPSVVDVESQVASFCEGDSNEKSRSPKKGPVMFVMQEDVWSEFPNPTCDCNDYCGHKKRRKILVRPGEESRNHRSNRLVTVYQAPRNESKSKATESEKAEKRDRLPSTLGPFVVDLNSRMSEDDVRNEEHLTTPNRGGTVEAHSFDPNRILEELFRTLEERKASGRAATRIRPLIEEAMQKRRDRQRDQIPDESAIRGNFIPLSTVPLQRSPSPGHGKSPQNVLVGLSLTDSQLDKLSAMLSREDEEPLPRGRHSGDRKEMSNIRDPSPSKRSRSPTKTHPSNSSPSRPRSRSPVKSPRYPKSSEGRSGTQGFEFDIKPQSPSKAKGSLSAHNDQAHGAVHMARGSPDPIDITATRTRARPAVLGKATPALVDAHIASKREPSPPSNSEKCPSAYAPSSVYSQDSVEAQYPSCVSPLRIQKEHEPKHLSILQDYMDWRDSPLGSALNAEITTETSSGAEAIETTYSPSGLAASQGLPSVRKASKTLIGENGWLERTNKRPDPNTSPSRKGGFLANLVKKAKGMVEANNTSPHRKSRESEKGSNPRPVSRQLAISLNPREQSLLYCELEFLLTTVLNEYITEEFNEGRLEADRLKRVAEEWQRKGHPKVVGFRYDLETQLDLVRMHLHHFRFYSRAATTAAITATIDTMRSNARVMRVRTFCVPDTVIAKQLLDSQTLFHILGAFAEKHMKLAEIVGFFKAGLERERLAEAERMRQYHQNLHPGEGFVEGQGQGGLSSPGYGHEQQGGNEYWGTTAATPVTATMGYTRHSNKDHGIGQGGFNMDPAGYDPRGE